MQKLLLMTLVVLILVTPSLAVYGEGETVADFSLPDPAGQIVYLYQTAALVTIIVFFTTW
ncbi:hypothetical protein H8E52_10540 [bacterium]|nr:hypothetical protein [bacterium]